VKKQLKRSRRKIGQGKKEEARLICCWESGRRIGLKETKETGVVIVFNVFSSWPGIIQVMLGIRHTT